MSGFVNPNQGGGYRFVCIHDYKFKTAPTEQEKIDYPQLVKTRTKEKSGAVVTEIESSLITGRLIEIGEREVTYEPYKENYIVLENEDGKFKFNLKYMGRPILTIMQRLPGIREDLPIQLGVFAADVPNQPDPNLKMALVYVRQQDADGKWVKVENQFPFDKENPENNVMPGFNKVKVKGKDVYDPTPQYEWLLQHPTNEYLGRLSRLVVAPAPGMTPPPPAKSPAAMQGGPATGAGAGKPAQTKSPAAVDPATAEHIGSAYEDDDLPF